MRRRRKKKKNRKNKKKKQEPRSKWHYIDFRGRAQKFVLKVSKLRPLISEQQAMSDTPLYLSTPSQYREGNSFLKIFRLCPLVLKKGSFNTKSTSH
jgi:hypothetical protein